MLVFHMKHVGRKTVEDELEKEARAEIGADIH